MLERHPNPHCATWHVRCCLTRRMIVAAESKEDAQRGAEDRRTPLQKLLSACGLLRDHFKESREEAKRLRPIFEALFGIDGVARVSVSPYEIHIAKGQAFTWGEIEPRISEVIDQYLAAIAASDS